MDITSVFTPIFLLQSTTFILSIVALIFGILSLKKVPKMRVYVGPILTYIVHLIIFYVFILYTDVIGIKPVYAQIINGWSSGIRLHLVLLLLTEFIFTYFWGKKWMD